MTRWQRCVVASPGPSLTRRVGRLPLLICPNGTPATKAKIAIIIRRWIRTDRNCSSVMTKAGPKTTALWC